MTRSVLTHIIVGHKPLNGPSCTVFGLDFKPIDFAPFGDFIGITFDFDDERASRDGAKDIAKLFLPEREGFRHFVIGYGDGSFVVLLAPYKNWAHKVIFSVLHWLSPVVDFFAGSFSRHQTIKDERLSRSRIKIIQP